MLLKTIDNYSGDSFLKHLLSEDALFHYTRKETVIESILPKMQLKFGCFSRANDPQEYRPKFIGAVGWGWDHGRNDVDNSMRDLGMLYQKRTRFSSFSINSFEGGKLKESGLTKSRMWAQYGDNHQGACLVFSKKKLLKLLEDQKQNHHIILDSLVEYKALEKSHKPILDVNQSDFSESISNDVALKFFWSIKTIFFLPNN